MSYFRTYITEFTSSQRLQQIKELLLLEAMTVPMLPQSRVIIRPVGADSRTSIIPDEIMVQLLMAIKYTLLEGMEQSRLIPLDTLKYGVSKKIP